MSPIVHFVRHAQGVHNLSHANHHLLDPELTPLGEEQARALGVGFPALENIQLILSSPLRRTIQTALLAFSSQVGAGLQVIAWPEVQEASDLNCDTGSDLLDIKAEFEKLPVDFTLVEPGWHIKVCFSCLICLIYVRLSKLHIYSKANGLQPRAGF
jgi:Fructose-2,6-bisphosphatase